jgi:hypothetical protein
MEMAAQADKPSALEAAVPVMWAVCGGLIYTAWNRVEEKSGQESVDKVRPDYFHVYNCRMIGF